MNLIQRAKNISFNKKNSGLVATNVQAAIDELATDYIVEEGTEGTHYNYRKWSSGIIEYWGTRTISIGANTWGTWGTHYYCNVNLHNFMGGSPTKFVSLPVYQINVSSPNGEAWGVSVGGTLDKVPNIYLYRPAAATKAFDITVNFYAIGKWK